MCLIVAFLWRLHLLGLEWSVVAFFLDALEAATRDAYRKWGRRHKRACAPSLCFLLACRGRCDAGECRRRCFAHSARVNALQKDVELQLWIIIYACCNLLLFYCSFYHFICRKQAVFSGHPPTQQNKYRFLVLPTHQPLSTSRRDSAHKGTN